MGMIIRPNRSGRRAGIAARGVEYGFAANPIGLAPRSLGGLILWLPPEAIQQSAGVITAWPDKSGQGNNPTPVSSPPFGSNVLNGYGGFVGVSTTGGRFDLPNVFTGLTSAEIFFVVKVGAGVGTLVNGLHNFGGSGELYPYVDEVWYEDFGTNSRKTAGTPILDPRANFRLVNIRAASGAWSCHMNHTQQFTTGVNTVAFDPSPQLYHAAGGDTFIGTGVETAMYNRVLSTNERNVVKNYFKFKYPAIGL